MNSNNKIIILLILFFFSANCSISKKVTIFSDFEKESFYFGEGSNGYYLLHIIKDENLFRYDRMFWDGYNFGKGYWNTQNNHITLAFDIQPPLERLLEIGSIFSDTVLLEKK